MSFIIRSNEYGNLILVNEGGESGSKFFLVTRKKGVLNITELFFSGTNELEIPWDEDYTGVFLVVEASKGIAKIWRIIKVFKGVVFSSVGSLEGGEEWKLFIEKYSA